MKWLPRSLWLLAWCSWAWLGWGLYRELPRDLGPPICILPLGDEQSFRGFREGTHEVVTTETNDDRPGMVRIWNAESGALVSECEGPVGEFSVRRDGLVVGKRSAAGAAMNHGASVLDLRTGAWTDLPAGCERPHCYHFTKPWAIFIVENEDQGPSGFRVLDLRSGTTLFAWNDVDGKASGFFRYANPVFVSESLVAVPTRKTSEVGEVLEERLEVWAIPKADRPLKEFRGVPVGDDLSGTEGGRIAWHIDSLEPWIDVFDIHQGRLVFAYPPKRERWTGGSSGHDFGLVLAHDGRSVYRHHLNKLFHVDSGRVLWELHEEQQVGPFRKREALKSVYWAGPFEVCEEWAASDGDHPDYQTYALRSFSDGGLLYRYSDMSSETRELSSDRRLLFRGYDNGIYRMPPAPNWPLLVLCQSILALPLVLLWAVLRWRRKRRMRLASAGAA